MKGAASGFAARLAEESEGPGAGRRMALPGALAGVAALVGGVLVGGALTSSHPAPASVVEALILPRVATAQAAPAVVPVPVGRAIGTPRAQARAPHEPIAAGGVGGPAPVHETPSRPVRPDPPHRRAHAHRTLGPHPHPQPHPPLRHSRHPRLHRHAHRPHHGHVVARKHDHPHAAHT